MSDTITTTDGKAGTAAAQSQAGKPATGAKAAAEASAAAASGKKARKGPVLVGTLILILLAAAGLVFGGRWLLDTINFVSTDDASIDGDHVNVSAKSLGRIAKMVAAEGDRVEAGSVLVLLDDADLRAQEAQTTASLNFSQKNVDLSKINLDRADADAARARTLFRTGGMTKEQLDHATSALDAASAQYAIALAQVDTARAQLGVIENQLLNTRIISPIAGVVAKKSMMQGDVVQPGQTIYTVNDLDRVWVTANFEETKIGRIRVGAPVEVSVDAYKSRSFAGTVELIGAGTLAPPFSIGDFTKTTQRVPVRISVDKGTPPLEKGAALIPGMSVEVKVKTAPLFKLPFGNKIDG